MFRLILAIIPLFAYVLAEPYVCSQLQTYDYVVNKTIYYPSTWNNTDSWSPQFAAGQKCEFVINIPESQYAMINIYANMTNSTLSVVDSIGNVDIVKVSKGIPFFMIAPSCRLLLDAQSVESFAFALQYYPVPAFTPNSYTVKAGADALVFQDKDADNGVVITADSRVSIVTFDVDYFFAGLEPLLRTTVIFDGPDMNSKFLGNLYQAYMSQHQLVSSGKQLTVFTLFPDVKTIVGTFSGIKCYTNIICPFRVDAADGPSVALSYSPADYLTKVNMSQTTSKLSVFDRAFVPKNKLVEYSSSDFNHSLPQKFAGNLRYYYLDKGSAIIDLSRSAIDSKWSKTRDGRKGFITSNNYGLSKSNQTMNELFEGSKYKYEFTLNIKSGANGLNGSAEMTVIVIGENNAESKTKYSKANLPTNPIVVDGYELGVTYDSKSEISNGIFVDFTMKQINSARIYGLAGTIMMVIYQLF
ncbi:unnamed protein product [Caenorhabditis bovis]|uniref:CUB-like domain-containing protein n=1 Tax=Caenorhabditis bovis TaxID=2654633 RepID=A0A8S1FBQ3_9PELO|nr:unnamed protein product [Caenorhabditis bovis]